MAAVKSSGRKFHLLGLLSDGGVHSHIRHVFALLDALKQAGVSRVFVHAITDGRDTAPTSAFGFIQQLQQRCQQAGVGRLADVVGRHFAMDRDKRWERVQKAVALYTQGKGEHVKPDELQVASAARVRGRQGQRPDDAAPAAGAGRADGGRRHGALLQLPQ